MSLYSDFNATTPLGQGAREAMTRAMEVWGNPSSSHRLGRKARELVEGARNQVARFSKARAENVVFTSGGSEANTAVLLGSFFKKGKGFRVLTSSVEHSSVRDTLSLLEHLGAEVQCVALHPTGALDEEAFESQMNRFSPDLVSLMTANNETGIVFPIPKISNLCKARGTPLHTDAVQALGKMDSAFFSGADFVSVSAHKVYGPKGCGALIVGENSALLPIHYGGSQEVKRRGGTENVIGICGFGGACSDAISGVDGALEGLRNGFELKIQSELTGIGIQGAGLPRLPNTSNIRFEGITSDILLTSLDLDGIYVSAGSACSSGSLTPSHVLIEMGLSPEAARECIRFSFGRTNTREEIDSIAECVIFHVRRIRERRIRKS